MTPVLVLTGGVNNVQGVLVAIDLDMLAVRVLDCWVISVGTKSKGENTEVTGGVAVELRQSHYSSWNLERTWWQC
jgi:hypothetical protein